MGETDRAAQIAQSILENPNVDRSDWIIIEMLITYVRILAQTGDVQGLQDVLSKAENIQNGDRKVEVLSQVAEAFAQLGNSQGVLSILGIAETLLPEALKARALGEISTALAQVQLKSQAWSSLCTAFEASRVSGRKTVFEVFSYAMTALTRIGAEETISKLYQAVVEVDGWWESPYGAKTLSG